MPTLHFAGFLLKNRALLEPDVTGQEKQSPAFPLAALASLYCSYRDPTHSFGGGTRDQGLPATQPRSPGLSLPWHRDPG